MSNINQSEDGWNAYLKDRPELSKYYHRTMDLAAGMDSQNEVDRFIQKRMPNLELLRYDVTNADNKEVLLMGKDSFLITDSHNVLNMTDG